MATTLSSASITTGAPATVFQAMHAKAIAWCHDFEQYKEECKVFAERLRVDFILYLGAKSTDVEFHVLDERLDRLRDEGTTLSPRLQVGDDGFLYFGLTLFFKSEGHCLDEHVRIGVQRGRTQWRVRWNQLEAPYSVEGSHQAFFDKVTAAMMEKFATPFRKIRGQLGFVPAFANDHMELLPVGEARLLGEAANATAGAAGSAI